jgi:chitosanase
MEADVYLSNQESRHGWRKKWVVIGTAGMLTIGAAAGTASAAVALPHVSVTQVDSHTLMLTASNVDPNSTVDISAVLDGTTDDPSADPEDISTTGSPVADEDATTVTTVVAPEDLTNTTEAPDDVADEAPTALATTDTTVADATTLAKTMTTNTTVATATKVGAPTVDEDAATAKDSTTSKSTKSHAKSKSAKHQMKKKARHARKHVRDKGNASVKADRNGRVQVTIDVPEGFLGKVLATIGSQKRGSHHTSRCSKNVKEDSADTTTTRPNGDSAVDDDATPTTLEPVSSTPTTTPTSLPEETDTTLPTVTTTPPATSPTTAAPSGSAAGLEDPAKKDIAMQLVSTNENSTLDWKAQYGYIEYNVEENDAENRGYTAGLVGFCSKCGDMSALVDYYNTIAPNNVLSKYAAALKSLAASESSATTGLGDAFVADWKTAAADPLFQQAQMHQLDAVYFNPAVSQAKSDGLNTLGQFIYYDAMVMHGPGSDALSFGGIRSAALAKAKTPAQGGDQTAYLNAFLDARKAAMLAEEGHHDTTRVDTEQRVFLQNGNLTLATPLTWSVYGESYTIK